MPHKRLSAWQKATALVPLALLSGAWTASLATTSTASAASATAGHHSHLPDGTSIPTQAIKAPASVTVPGEIAPGVPAGATESIISGSSANGIPAAALAAYQRAAQVIDAADPTCHIDWQLIAAIGRVESDHGRYGGNTLSADGISKPGIYGIPLDGSNGTATVADTDAGQYDNDPVSDRAVGPMQFIPSTWSIVGVDGDGDGKRNPQDINDASLATAVYLCSGKEDLSTAAGQRSAVYRYNHSQDYVNLVLSIMRAYTDGDYSAVPTGTAAPVTFTPAYGDSVVSPHAAGRKAHSAKSGGASASTSHSSKSSATAGNSNTPASGASAPSAGTTPSVPGSGDTSDPAKKTTDQVKKVTKPVKKVTKPVVDTLSAGAEAVNFCSAQLAGITSDSTVVNKCAAKVAGMTKDDAAAVIPKTLGALLNWLGLPSLPGLGG
jgi:membrane-bound lytic murein transglycosylase B